MFSRQIKYLLTFLSIVLISQLSFAQFQSAQNRFTVDFVEGCNTLNVIITPDPILYPCPCNIYFDGGSGNPVDDNIGSGELTHTITYTDAGTYNLIVVHENLDRDSIQIVVNENIAPEFTASSCSSLEVAIDIIDTNYDNYVVNYGDGSADIVVAKNNNPSPYTYALPSPPNYTVSVRGINIGAKDNCNTSSTSVEIVNILPNATITSLTLTSSDEATMEFTIPQNVQYFLEIQPNSDNLNGFQKYIREPLTSSPLQISDDNLDFDANFYCFRIATFDPCNNTAIDYSNTLCSVDLQDIIVNNLSNRLDIRSGTNGLTEHEVQLFDKNIGDFNRLFNFTSTSYDHNLLICNTEYCYRIVSNFSGAISTSLPRCATALSLNTPVQISDISIDATSNPILSWSDPIGFVADTFQISTPTSLLGVSTTPTYTDNTSNATLASACYQIGYVDECKNIANISNEVCSIYLSKSTSNNLTTLSWTSFDGWSAGVSEYQLFENGIVISTGSNTSFEISNVQNIQKATYQVIAIPNDGFLLNSLSNIVIIANRSNITFPNAIVADGTNSEFKVVGRYIVNYDLKIYTRWGELIAHITDPNIGWDGRSNGRILQEGNYIYSAEIEDEAGNIHQKNGTVLLIRR